MRPRPIRVVLLGLLCASNALGERVVEHYDLDTLSKLSDAIVRAQIDGAEPVAAEGGQRVVYTVTVSAALKGPIAAGQHVRLAPSPVYKRCRDLKNDDETYEPLGKGDVVYLFLEPDEKFRADPAAAVPSDASRRIISCGVRLLSDGGGIWLRAIFSAVGIET